MVLMDCGYCKSCDNDEDVGGFLDAVSDVWLEESDSE